MAMSAGTLLSPPSPAAILRGAPAACSAFSSSVSGTRLRGKRTEEASVGRGRRRRRSSASLMAMAMGPDLLGDFGARDPFPEEIESNFGENIVGNGDTEHKILIPNLSALSLSQQRCEPIPVPSPPMPMPRVDAEKLLKKVVGWRLVEGEGEGAMRIQCLWKLRDYSCCVELINRIYKAVESAGHYPSLHLEQPNQVRAELWTEPIGGLSLNDFIVAAKIDEVKALDLLPKKRIWA